MRAITGSPATFLQYGTVPGVDAGFNFLKLYQYQYFIYRIAESHDVGAGNFQGDVVGTILFRGALGRFGAQLVFFDP